jgi:hypothetical protein
MSSPAKPLVHRWMAWHEVGKKLKRKCRGALAKQADTFDNVSAVSKAPNACFGMRLECRKGSVSSERASGSSFLLHDNPPLIVQTLR